jgi:exosome complex component RRP42
MAATSISKAEKSYIQAGLLATPPRRADGRTLDEYRAIELETGVVPLANGSARIRVGAGTAKGGTEVLAACKVEVENIEGDEQGRVVVTVTW